MQNHSRKLEKIDWWLKRWNLNQNEVFFCYLKTKKVIGEGSKPIMHPLEVDLFDLEIGEKGN